MIGNFRNYTSSFSQTLKVWKGLDFIPKIFLLLFLFYPAFPEIGMLKNTLNQCRLKAYNFTYSITEIF